MLHCSPDQLNNNTVDWLSTSHYTTSFLNWTYSTKMKHLIKKNLGTTCSKIKTLKKTVVKSITSNCIPDVLLYMITDTCCLYCSTYHIIKSSWQTGPLCGLPTELQVGWVLSFIGKIGDSSDVCAPISLLLANMSSYQLPKVHVHLLLVHLFHLPQASPKVAT